MSPVRLWGLDERRRVEDYHLRLKAAHHDEIVALLVDCDRGPSKAPWPEMRIRAALRFAAELGKTTDQMHPRLAAEALYHPGVDASKLQIPRSVRAELVRMLTDAKRAAARRGPAEVSR